MNNFSAYRIFEENGQSAGRFVELDLRFVGIALAFQLANLALRSFALRNVLAAAYPDYKTISVPVDITVQVRN